MAGAFSILSGGKRRLAPSKDAAEGFWERINEKKATFRMGSNLFSFALGPWRFLVNRAPTFLPGTVCVLCFSGRAYHRGPASLQTRFLHSDSFGSSPEPKTADGVNKLLLETLEEETATQSTGLVRIRDETGDAPSVSVPTRKTPPGDLAKFATESLHSYRFSSTNEKVMAESRKSFLSRSFDYMRSKFPNWERNVVSPLAAHFSPAGESHIRTAPAPPRGGEDLQDGALKSPVAAAQVAATPAGLTPSASESPEKDQKLGGLKPKEHIFVRTQNLHGSLPAPTSPGIHFSAVHSPTRYCPRLQAVLTTDSSGQIQVANEASCRVFGCAIKDIVGTNVLELLTASSRDTCKQQFLMQTDAESHAGNGVVLHCGKVLQILRRDGNTSTASLWMKRKQVAATRQHIFIWVFEEIVASQAEIKVSEEGVIQNASGALKDIFGHTGAELKDTNITDIFPAVPRTSAEFADGGRKKLDFKELARRSFVAGKFADGSCFPLTLQLKDDAPQRSKGADVPLCLTITSLVTISGMVITSLDGTITAGNDSFLKHMFAYSAAELVEGRKNISVLIPQFPQLIQNLPEDLASAAPAPASARSPRILSSSYWRMQATLSPLPRMAPNPADGRGAAGGGRLSAIPATPQDDSTRTTTTDSARALAAQPPAPLVPSAPPLAPSPPADKSATGVSEAPSPSVNPMSPGASSVTGITGMHRDGFPISIDIQIRVLRSHAEMGAPAYAIWITYDRSLLHPDDNDQIAPDVAQKQDGPEFRGEGEPAEKFAELEPKTPADQEKAAAFGLEIKPKSINDYQLLETMGEGAYGFAKLAVRKNDANKRKKVIKFILKGRILVECWSKDPEIGVVPLEIRILHQLSKSPHPNIIEMKHFFQDANCFYIEMDLFGFGTDLFDYIELNRNMTEDEMKRIYLQTCLAVQHLHDRGIAHRDIKDENLIVGENSHIRLIDFGSSAYVRSGKMFETFCGTLDYAAPEVLEGCKYKGKPQDIWAMGILLYTLVYKENPFYNVDEIISGSLRVPFVVSAANLNLIRSILNRDPEKRPTIVAILEHEWLAGVKEELDFPLPGRGDDPPPPHRPRAA